MPLNAIAKLVNRVDLRKMILIGLQEGVDRGKCCY
jgi:hypothetical protein